jgi:hypothetical protein
MASSSSSSPPSSDPSLETVAPHAAVTGERKLNPNLQEQLPKPCKRFYFYHAGIEKKTVLSFHLSFSFSIVFDVFGQWSLNTDNLIRE